MFTGFYFKPECYGKIKNGVFISSKSVIFMEFLCYLGGARGRRSPRRTWLHRLTGGPRSKGMHCVGDIVHFFK
jgi:hypothetical protein